MTRLRLACTQSCSRLHAPFGHVHYVLNRSDDVEVGAAAADVAAHQLTDVVRRARMAFGHQTNGGADLSWCAVATLECVVIDEGLLERVKRSVLSKPFDRRHSGAVLHDRQGQARIDPPAIDEDGARSALTVIA